MIKDFEERVVAYENGEESFMALSDYDILGEEMALITALGDQLTLYSTILSDNAAYKKGERVGIPIDTLWGLGQVIKKLIDEVQTKVDVIDKKFDLCVKEEYKRDRV